MSILLHGINPTVFNFLSGLLSVVEQALLGVWYRYPLAYLKATRAASEYSSCHNVGEYPSIDHRYFRETLANVSSNDLLDLAVCSVRFF
jgi:hypothetical protein